MRRRCFADGKNHTSSMTKASDGSEFPWKADQREHERQLVLSRKIQDPCGAEQIREQAPLGAQFSQCHP